MPPSPRDSLSFSAQKMPYLDIRMLALPSFRPITESIDAQRLHLLAAGPQRQVSWVFLFILNVPSLLFARISG